MHREKIVGLTHRLTRYIMREPPSITYFLDAKVIWGRPLVSYDKWDVVSEYRDAAGPSKKQAFF